MCAGGTESVYVVYIEKEEMRCVVRFKYYVAGIPNESAKPYFYLIGVIGDEPSILFDVRNRNDLFIYAVCVRVESFVCVVSDDFELTDVVKEYLTIMNILANCKVTVLSNTNSGIVQIWETDF